MSDEEIEIIELKTKIDLLNIEIKNQQKELEKKEFHLKATEQQRLFDMKYIDELKGLLNNKIDLIKEQQKEIEELKEQNIIQRKQLHDAFDRGWIHKDKIKAILEEVDYKMIAHQDVREAVKQVLNSLLEKE